MNGIDESGSMTMSARSARPAHAATGARLTAGCLALTLALSACGGEREPETLPGVAIGDAIASLGEDSVAVLATGDTLRVSAATVAFYRGREWHAAWVGPKRILDRGTAVHEAIGRSWEDGLPPARYRHDSAEQILAALTASKDARLPDSVAVRYLADLDLVLTEGFNRLASDLVTGMLDPREAGLDWLIATEVAREEVVLNNVIAGMAPAEIVAYLRPSIPYYDRMRAALVRYHEAERRGGWPQVPEGVKLEAGVRDPAVAALRTRLLASEDPTEAARAQSGAADAALFDSDLRAAVQHFQERHGIAADGKVGAGTLKELNHTVEERLTEMKLNLDRWRWLPNSLGDRFVIVNIAGFELEVVDDGRVIESMNVVVGQRDLQTPVFADSIQHVVVNPYWNVPNGIMERKIRPAMAADPYYLEKNDMEVVNGRVRQRPGPKNSLGRYKFLFPNEFDVYLHDTPEGHLFARDQRAFSSGCVRIERPGDFGKLLLRLQSDRDPDSLDRLLVAGAEQWIKLDRPLKVYLLYFTAWVQEDGTVRFHHDVYGRDAAMDEQVEELRAAPAPPPAGRVATH
jgi:L,D-transpeptidase YcbB